MDFKGILIGLLSFISVFFIVFYLLKKYELNRVSILHLVIFCALGHFAGGIAYYELAIHKGADSIFYFNNATTHLTGVGYHFAFYVLGYLRTYFISDSFLGAFLFFGALGFLGSVFYLLAFKILLDKICGPTKYYLVNKKILFLPALLLLCWPSYFLWSAGLVKDNFAFLSIGIFLFFLAENKLTIPRLAFFIFGISLGFIVRPYLFITVCLSAGLYILTTKKMSSLKKICIVLAIALAFCVALPQLLAYKELLSFSGTSLKDVTKFAVNQQHLMNIGSSILMPTHNPILMLFFLPYLMLANLLLPLGLGASNAIGIIGSIENAFLLWWLVFFLKNKPLWKAVQEKAPITKFYFIFCLMGMAFLGMMNTNLGLAMREKMMYVPPLLICVFLMYAYKKILELENFYTLSQEKGLSPASAAGQ